MKIFGGKMKQIEEDNIIYFIGRNAQDNFDLYDKMNSNDLFFHVSDHPGSHVYIKEGDISEDSIRRAAELAVEYSKIKEKCKVCYLPKKYIKKSKPVGTVLLLREPEYISIIPE